jgi:hypothetical protein
VNSASAITRGFINVTKWGSRFTKLGREANEWRDTGIAVLFMVVDSSSLRFVFVKSAISPWQGSGQRSDPGALPPAVRGSGASSFGSMVMPTHQRV